METLAHRFTLYDVKCGKKPRQYAILKVFEVSEDGRTLDYGKTGSQKDWEDIPPETIVDRLAKIVCPYRGPLASQVFVSYRHFV
jgi:hypothetical protein